MDTLNLTIQGDVERLTLGPDDLVVVRLHGTEITEEISERVQNTVRKTLERAGHYNQILIFVDDYASIEVIGN